MAEFVFPKFHQGFLRGAHRIIGAKEIPETIPEILNFDEGEKQYDVREKFLDVAVTRTGIYLVDDFVVMTPIAEVHLFSSVSEKYGGAKHLVFLGLRKYPPDERGSYENAPRWIYGLVFTEAKLIPVPDGPARGEATAFPARWGYEEIVKLPELEAT